MSNVVSISHPSGARAEIHKYGATVTFFSTAQDPSRNLLFVSQNAVLDGSKPIRGGIPIVFPVFGPAEGFPNHGFARTMNWELLEDVQEGEGEAPTVASFFLKSTPETKKIWDFDFELVFDVELFPEHLVTALHVRNTSETAFSFQALLHTYFSVDHINETKVEGLQNLSYFDKVSQQKQTEERSEVNFKGETDSVYANAPAKIVVRMPKRSVTIEKIARVRQGEDSELTASDAVVWNPWEEKAKGMGDFGDDEYLHMVCVEPGRVSEKQELASNYEFTLLQTIRPSAL